MTCTPQTQIFASAIMTMSCTKVLLLKTLLTAMVTPVCIVDHAGADIFDCVVNGCYTLFESQLLLAEIPTPIGQRMEAATGIPGCQLDTAALQQVLQPCRRPTDHMARWSSSVKG